LYDGQVWTASVRAAGSDRGTLRGTASGLSALHSRRGRFSGSAVERIPSTSSGRPAHHANPKVVDKKGARLTRGDAEKRSGQVCRVLEAVRTGAERRPELRLR